MTTEALNQLVQTLWDLGSYQSRQNPTPIILVADVANGAGESRYSALRIPGAAGGYQVTPGKTLYLTKVIIAAGALNAQWLTLTGTADAGSSQLAAPAGAASIDSRADGIQNPIATQAALVPSTHNILLKAGSALYPCIRNLTASTTLWTIFLGHEE